MLTLFCVSWFCLLNYLLLSNGKCHLTQSKTCSLLGRSQPWASSSLFSRKVTELCRIVSCRTGALVHALWLLHISCCYILCLGSPCSASHVTVHAVPPRKSLPSLAAPGSLYTGRFHWSTGRHSHEWCGREPSSSRCLCLSLPCCLLCPFDT